MAQSTPGTLATVTEGLNYDTVDELKKLLSLLPETGKPSRKAELVSVIAEQLQGNKLQALWDQLDEIQQKAVAETAYADESEFQTEQFLAKYGSLPNWGKQSRYIHGYIEQHSRLALFFYKPSAYQLRLVMPDDLKERLRQFVPKPQPLTLRSQGEMPATTQIQWREFDFSTRKYVNKQEEVEVTHCDMERAAQQDLLAVLRFIHLGKVAVSDKTFMPTKATVQALSDLLQGKDYYPELAVEGQTDDIQEIGAIKAFAWPLIVQAAGLAALEGKKLQLTTTGQKAMGADPAKTIKAMWKKWIKTRLIDELRRIEVIKGQTGKGQRGLTALDKRRSVIANALVQCPVGQWVMFDDFLRYMIASNQYFEVTRSPENLYVAEAGYGNLYDTGQGWNILQTSYLRCFLFEYAATMGLLDVAYISPYQAPSGSWRELWGADDLDFFSRYDGLIGFRLTPLGAYCLGLTSAYQSAPIIAEPVLRVLPNFDIVVTGRPLSSAEILMLETYTQQKSDAVWQLARDQVLAAIAEGQQLSDFREFLEQASVGALPEIVQQFFTDVESRSQSLKDQGLARLIKCAHATLATLIANDSHTKKYCFLAGDCHLVVPIEHETRFRNALRKLGYTLPLQ